MARRWFKGSLDTHTANGDVDSTPDEVVAWHRDAGYGLMGRRGRVMVAAAHRSNAHALEDTARQIASVTTR